jgi:LytR cell envelope-related transcriptional attenuator
MSSPTKRRPLPALLLLIALTVLTALVWWRVLHREDGQAAAGGKCPTPRSSAAVLPRPTSVAVSVLNSTTRIGLARTTATTLTSRGFKVVGYGNDNPKVHVAGVAEIRFGPAQKKDAALLAYYFRGAKLVPLTADPLDKVVVSLGAKFKTVSSNLSAVRAMTSAHVTLAPIKAASTVPSGSAPC